MDTPLTSQTALPASVPGSTTKTEPRPCERRCTRCKEWKHYSRFRSFKTRYGVTQFRPKCKACEQIERNEKKNADRPAAIIDNRAANQASKAGVAKSFFLVNMNFRALVPMLRAMMTPEGLCTSCGHPFLNERDIQLEHREPPRHSQDWARLHARNIGLACTSCNGTKGPKPYAIWLDEQESTRLTNEYSRSPQSPDPPMVPVQLSFD
jgi:5-methylcytosine-specific restriction endonuclease McrA